MTGEDARRILHSPRRSGTVGPWQVGDTIETPEQAELLQSILDGEVTVESALEPRVRTLEERIADLEERLEDMMQANNLWSGR